MLDGSRISDRDLEVDTADDSEWPFVPFGYLVAEMKSVRRRRHTGKGVSRMCL